MLRYKEIKNMLAAEIAKMNCNDRLPSRSQLCKKLDTAKATLDKAINELLAEGLLYSKGGVGTYVADVANASEEAFIHGGNWGVIVRDVREPFYADMVRGVENVAQRYEINVVLCNSDSDFDKQEKYIKRLNHTVSGMIVAPVVSEGKRENDLLINQLNGLKIPFVSCSRLEGIDAPMVLSNNFYGGYIVTRHLLEKGYRNIAYISHRKIRTSVDRFQGYISALMENGIEVNQQLVLIGEKSSSQPFGLEAMRHILTSGQPVDAVFCLNDKVASGVYQAISEAGLRVSDEIGVVGYDNSDICEKSIPAITSVSLNNMAHGTKAAEALYRKINKENFANFDFYLIKPDIVVRASCLGPAKLGGSGFF
jgi:DNA-binding LacI/PurR family transcriptional regulator